MAGIEINNTPLGDSIIMLKGSYDALLKPADVKDYVSNDDPNKDGTEYSVPEDYEPKVKERQVTLLFSISGPSNVTFQKNKEMFIRLIQQGLIKLYVPDLGRSFFLLYQTCTSFNYHHPYTCDLAIRFIEPDPTKTSD